MIFYIKGIVAQVNEDSVVLETAGIGYEIFCKDSHKFFVDQEKEIKFYIFEHIQETSHTLYGFSTPEELQMLKILISVKGIGPKVGLRILNAVNLGVIIEAVEKDDPNLFPKIKSVGDKAKKRLVNELKGKFPEDLVKKVSSSEPASAGNSLVNEALEALMSLGMSQREAEEAIENAPKELDNTGDLVKWALRKK